MPALDKNAPAANTPAPQTPGSPVIVTGGEEWKQHLINTADPLAQTSQKQSSSQRVADASARIAQASQDGQTTRQSQSTLILPSKKDSPPLSSPRPVTPSTSSPSSASDRIATASDRIAQAQSQSPIEVASQKIHEAFQASPQAQIERASLEGKQAQKDGLILPPTKKVPPVPEKQDHQSKKAALLGGALIGAAAVGKIITQGYKAANAPTPHQDNWQASHNQGWSDWSKLLFVYKEQGLEDVHTLEDFKDWLNKHPGATFPGTDQKLTLKDWDTHEQYAQYLVLQAQHDHPQQETKQTVHKHDEQHAAYFHPIHAHVEPEEKAEPSSGEPNQQPQSPLILPSFRRSSATPPPIMAVAQAGGGPLYAGASSPTGGGPTFGGTPPPPPPPAPGGGSGGRRPPMRSGRGVPGLNGGGLGNLASNALNRIPQVRIATAVWRNKVIIGVALFVLLILIVNIFSGDSSNVPASAEITTVDTTVSNPSADTSQPPEKDQQGIATSLLTPYPSISPPKQEVLGTASDLFKYFILLLVQGKQKLEDLAQKYKDSLITYTITTNYGGDADEVIVHYHIPDNALFIRASGTFTTQTQTVNGLQKTTDLSWKYSENNGVASTSTSSPSADTARNTDTSTARNTGTDTSSTERNTSTTTKIDITKYEGAPYYLPPPKGTPTITYDAQAINNANTLGAAIASIQPYLLTKLSPEKADPFLSVMWTMAIEGSGADPYFWNCNETSKGKQNISKGCVGWYNSGNWQVGYGIQVAQAGSHLADDFKAIYGTTEASKVQEVGNAVIKGGGITNPSTMPSKTVEELVQEAGKPGTTFQYRQTTAAEAAAQQAIAILLMDPKIGAASIAQEVAGDIGNNWAQSMRNWGQSYYINGLDPNNPTFSNNIKQLAEQYTGTSNGVSSSGGGGLGQRSFTVTVLPLTENDVVHSGKPYLEVINPRGGSSTTGTLNQQNTTTGTSSGTGCTKISDPSGSDWTKVNSRDQLILQKVLEVQKEDGPSKGTCIPVNLVKALVYEESGGEMLPVNGAGYGGIMQVGVGSNCDHTKYDIYTLDGNVGCGISHLTRGYVECGSWEGTITAYYAGHCTPNGASDDPAQGGSGETDYQYRDKIIGRWHQIDQSAN